jgi:signal transduction histidine kinase
MAGFPARGSGRLQARRPAPTRGSGGRFRPPTPSGAGSPRICTTARNSGSSRCASRSASRRSLSPTIPRRRFAQLERLGAEIDAVLAELQDLAHGIYPPTLARRGLADALSEIARELPLPVRLDARGLRRYPELIETTVYFICREALQNAVKHAAGAQGVDVTLADTGTRLTFEVADDGCGFDADAPPGVGFQTMRSRIAAAGGELTIPATAGAGTHVRGSLPLPHRRPTRKGGRLSSARRRVPGSTESTDP